MKDKKKLIVYIILMILSLVSIFIFTTFVHNTILSFIGIGISGILLIIAIAISKDNQ